MANARGETAGGLVAKTERDSTSYDSMEAGHALADTVEKELWTCIDNHLKIIDEPEFCVVMTLADDCIIKGVMRRKFYAWPYLPKPRPRQSVFLYRRSDDKLQFLWALPEAFAMASLSTMSNVGRPWRRMKGWCDAFFSMRFWEHIREQAEIELLSEQEYLERHRKELTKALDKNVAPPLPDTFDFAKVL